MNLAIVVFAFFAALAGRILGVKAQDFWFAWGRREEAPQACKMHCSQFVWMLLAVAAAVTFMAYLEVWTSNNGPTVSLTFSVGSFCIKFFSETDLWGRARRAVGWN